MRKFFFPGVFCSGAQELSPQMCPLYNGMVLGAASGRLAGLPVLLSRVRFQKAEIPRESFAVYLNCPSIYADPGGIWPVGGCVPYFQYGDWPASDETAQGYNAGVGAGLFCGRHAGE